MGPDNNRLSVGPDINKTLSGSRHQHRPPWLHPDMLYTEGRRDVNDAHGIRHTHNNMLRILFVVNTLCCLYLVVYTWLCILCVVFTWLCKLCVVYTWLCILCVVIQGCVNFVMCVLGCVNFVLWILCVVNTLCCVYLVSYTWGVFLQSRRRLVD